MIILKYFAFLLLAFTALSLSSCKEDDTIAQVSELPAQSTGAEQTLGQSRPGTFGLRARVSYADIEAIAAEQLPNSHPVADAKRLCKRVIGIKVCGTARWDLIIDRPGALKVSGKDGIIYLQTPISFAGKVGVEGRMASALGLSGLDVSGLAQADIALSVHMGENWCPSVRTDVSYRWIQKPTLVYQNSLDFSLESIVNEALDKQLATIETRLNDTIDCPLFKKQLDTAWRSYSFALDLPTEEGDGPAQKVHLNVVPTDFAFSGLRTEENALGVSFALGATTIIESNPQPVNDLTLPPLKQVSFAQSRTDFDLALRASYTQLEQLLRPSLLSREFNAESAAGNVSVTVTSFGLSGNAEDVTVALGFTAKVPARRKNINGLLYLRASPELNAEREQLVLRNIRLSRVLDSTLWELLSRIFEDQIIASLERNSVLDLGPRLRALETSLTSQLEDPKRTSGLIVKTTDLSINILEVVAENDALAARARVSSEFDIDIPLAVMQRPRK